MMRRMAVIGIGLLLCGTSVAAEQKGKAKKHQDAKHAGVHEHDADTPKLAVHVSWSTRDVEIIRRHYGPKYRRLPPGLQKKYERTGHLPPGWQKKMEPFPARLEHECAPLPAGYRRGVIDGHAVIYNTRGVIIDVAILF